MKKDKMKRTIYMRTFSALFAIYLALMAGFGIFLILQEKKVKGLELGTFALQVNNRVGEILQEHMDSDNCVADILKLKKDFVRESFFAADSRTELAVYTGDYDLIFHTSDNWICSYTEYSEGSKNYIGYGYLNPEDWFNEKELEELDDFLRAEPKPEKPGDLAGYSLALEGFWMDNEMIIPEKIYVTPIYASSFYENGDLESSGGTRRDDMVYVSGYNSTGGLPYFKHGSIQPLGSSGRADEKQLELRSMVLNKERLKEASQQLGNTSCERISPVTYRYYLLMPYQNRVKVEEDSGLYSEAWTVIAREVNLLDQCAGTLAFVWVSCFIAFLTAALILSAQTYKTYQKREALERHRKETTDALAHDLKTPLSIISGYAQNLLENINTEKREYYAGNIRDNVDRMDKIIREMLELSKLESDRLLLKIEDVSLGEVCNGIMNRYNQICCEKSITVSREGDAVIKADRTLAGRVTDNFFVNALDHTPDGGTIRIRITDTTFEFYNSGSRIPEEKLNEIWQPYQKADTSRGNTKGTGLGLSISRTILELYQFPYGAQNSDNGVIFWFKFA
ncbi:MAG TPA: HAMP domain-containing sensor histidine kinase [Anaerovoracaceae bacterium]|nr:HAMP domain-containing sensor histidine kinase [Anaerovoracaceae bacterium]